MTLDCFLSDSHTVKGHFCSLLISNIIGYLAFLDSTTFFILFYHQRITTSNCISLKRDDLLCGLVSYEEIARFTVPGFTCIC